MNVEKLQMMLMLIVVLEVKKFLLMVKFIMVEELVMIEVKKYQLMLDFTLVYFVIQAYGLHVGIGYHQYG